MPLEVATDPLVAGLLASVRAGAWLAIAPPFSSRAIPAPVKALLSVAIGLPAITIAGQSVPALEVAPLLSAVALQVVVGAALGFLCYLVLVAVQTAGDLLDVFGGFSLAFAFDPLMQTGNAVLGRFYQMTALALLLASGGYLVMLGGFLRSYQAIPLDGGLDLGTLAAVLQDGVGQMLLAALQIAAPLLAVLFLADVALGLLTRVAPALNAFALGFPFKILLTLLLVSAGFIALPGIVGDLARQAGALIVQVAQR